VNPPAGWWESVLTCRTGSVLTCRTGSVLTCRTGTFEATRALTSVMRTNYGVRSVRTAVATPVGAGLTVEAMFQVRIHGRGGQGVVTAAEMLSVAAFYEGRHAQAFPSFGSERTGAPVVSFCRIDDREIRVREPIMEPDALIIQDPTLLHQVDLFGGLRPDGFILINTAKSFDELGLGEFVEGFRHERC